MPPFKKPHQKLDQNKIIQQNEEKTSFQILPKGLNIVWGNDPRYWKVPESGPAELIQVSWLEVSSVVIVGAEKKYKVSFKVNVKEDGFGWNGTDVLVMAKVGKTGRYSYNVTNLNPGERNKSVDIEIEARKDSQLHFGLYEVWSGKWKGGLEIIEAVVQSVD
ncbi:hypothetical protein Fmac_008288 [Flemingia macrophylla]|uniref:Phloem protein 2 n=1 Tax=Flemingia macrophylla TaxID=520843 RepID=A0ABD1MX07_9FABA